MDLRGAEIFQTGVHNGTRFDEGHLDGIVSSFEFFNLGGRIPLKIGHNDQQPLTDGQPALGWVSRIWRDGKKLLADFVDVPRAVYDAIREGRYKHVSVELLRDVQADTRTVPLMLDAVALLGADVPAIGTLRDLQSLTLSRLRGAERLTFTKQFLEVRTMNETALRDENERLRAALHRQTIDHAIESDVRARLVRPAAREQFARLLRLTDDASYSRITSNDWREFARTQPRPPASGPASRPTGEGTPHLAPDEALAERVRERIAQHFAVTQGRERLDFGRAAALVVAEAARTDPGLLRAWVDLPGVQD